MKTKFSNTPTLRANLGMKVFWQTASRSSEVAPVLTISLALFTRELNLDFYKTNTKSRWSGMLYEENKKQT